MQQARFISIGQGPSLSFLSFFLFSLAVLFYLLPCFALPLFRVSSSLSWVLAIFYLLLFFFFLFLFFAFADVCLVFADSFDVKSDGFASNVNAKAYLCSSISNG